MARSPFLALRNVSFTWTFVIWVAPSCFPYSGLDLSEASASCSNLTLDSDESDVDCGGACSPCQLGKRCHQTSDCAEGSCIESVCREPSCGDRSLSPGETDVDCGGAHCAPCAAFEACEMNRDCSSNECREGRCTASVPGTGGADDLGGSGSSSSTGETGGQSGSGGSTGGTSATGGSASGGTSAGGTGGAGTGGTATSLCETAGFAFCEDFEGGNADGWSTSGGTWSVVSLDTNFVYQGGGGSEESMAGSTSWTDQIVEGSVKVVSFGGTGSAYRAGLIARFSGPSDFFTFSFDQTGQLRLLKSTSTPSGATGVCGDLSYTVETGTWYRLRMDVSGPEGSIQIQTYVNDVLQHDCQTTADVTEGQAGVLTVGSNTVAQFDDVTVTVP